MSGNTFGRIFRVTTWGESHGPAVGAVIDGCPPGIELGEDCIERELARRAPSLPYSTPRKEPDKVMILSGVFSGRTLGTPISLIIKNRDVKSSHYEPLKNIYRPGHADITYQKKYGIRDYRGGGRSSARETVSRVAAGAVAKRVLETFGVKIYGYTIELGGVRAQKRDLEAADKNPVYSPDMEAAEDMLRRLKEVAASGDTVGGIVEVVAKGVPPGLGEPVFDKLSATLSHALMSIGSIKGIEIGAGFNVARMLGSRCNDPITPGGFSKNDAGGILGGISTGEEIVLRVAVKPVPSIKLPQRTIDSNGNPVTIEIKGRHDVSPIPRVVPVCEAMVAITLVDHILIQRGITGKV